jgi:3-oxoacyl-(acyl-carrier-protein) synthase
MQSDAVAVTGIGAVSGLGWGVAPLWDGLRAGRSAIGPFQRFDHALHRTHIAAEAAGEPPADLVRAVAGWDRLSIADQFAVAAAVEAAGQAGLSLPLDESMDEGREAGVFFGSSTGGMWEGEAFFRDFLRDRRRSRLRDLVSFPVNAPGDALARHLRVTGPVRTISSACASGALALGAALEALRSGTVDVALAGGSDSLCQLTYAGFNALRSVDDRPCRPFRAERAGMSFGEGAAVLVLEPLERALARGVTPLAVFAGAGASCDAHHMTAPDPSGNGAAAALEAALRDAGLDPAEIDFVNAHGTGTPLNDAAEWNALRRVFGERAAEMPVVATKALLGHLLGTSGAIEAIATVLCLNHGELHPVPACEVPAMAEAAEVSDAAPGEEIRASLVLDRPLPLPEARSAISTSLAFGGSNAALVFSRWAGRAA